MSGCWDAVYLRARRDMELVGAMVLALQSRIYIQMELKLISNYNLNLHQVSILIINFCPNSPINNT